MNKVKFCRCVASWKTASDFPRFKQLQRRFKWILYNAIYLPSFKAFFALILSQAFKVCGQTFSSLSNLLDEVVRCQILHLGIILPCLQY
jgi:hypothetical protein